MAVLAVLGLQWRSARHPAPRAAVLGAQQTLFGLAVVVATAIGSMAR